ncbi:hypothetical protein KAR91_63405 [Candidatus Pacearchaeota archaeon]|nr:hypothetical protein [Candidatus Pacearchaeota archaeon]
MEKYTCNECSKKFVPKRKPRKTILCPKCKRAPKKFTCVICGEKEKPLKNSRKKTFLCKSCRQDKKAFTKIKSSKERLPLEEFTTYLTDKEFLLSSTGIPYKYYGNIRVSIGNTTDIPLIVVKQGNDSTQCYNGTAVETALPDEAIMDLKPIINTIGDLWEKQR